VVGVQARRLGVVVTLRPAPQGGLLAVMQLDAVLSAPALAAAAPGDGAPPATRSPFADAVSTATVSTSDGANATNRTTEVES
jgi:hypothetical protein